MHSTVDDKDAFGSEPMTVGSIGFFLFTFYISAYISGLFLVLFLGGSNFRPDWRIQVVHNHG